MQMRAGSRWLGMACLTVAAVLALAGRPMRQTVTDCRSTSAQPRMPTDSSASPAIGTGSTSVMLHSVDALHGDLGIVSDGDLVLALGSAFGLTYTATAGIISATGRSGIGIESYEDFIQTDAAINPGNSGGPLLDSRGNVIAINTAIYGPSGNIGIGFAMPINRAKTMIEDYQSNRKYGRPRLGVDVVYVFGDLATELGLPEEGGLLVQDVAEGSAAAAAGLPALKWDSRSEPDTRSLACAMALPAGTSHRSSGRAWPGTALVTISSMACMTRN